MAGERLACPYHGWSYDRDGNGQCAGTIGLPVQTRAYEVVERHRTIFVRERDTDAPEETPLPSEWEGFHTLVTLRREVPAPLPLLVDNFAEIEHTGVAHWAFGFPQSSLKDVTVTAEDRPDGVFVRYEGLQKPEGWQFMRTVGVRDGDRMVMTAFTSFAPLNTLYDIRWYSPAGQERSFRIMERAYFAGISDRRALLYCTYNLKFPRGVRRLMKLIGPPMLSQMVQIEYELDRHVLAMLDPEHIDLKGYRLGRWDKSVVLHRRRMVAAGLMDPPARRTAS